MKQCALTVGNSFPFFMDIDIYEQSLAYLMIHLYSRLFPSLFSSNFIVYYSP